MPMTPTGWRLVPVEATEDQEHATAEVSLTFARAIHSSSIPSAEVYGAMLAAAPDPLQDERMVDQCAIELALVQHRGGTKHDQVRAVLALFRGEQP